MSADAAMEAGGGGRGDVPPVSRPDAAIDVGAGGATDGAAAGGVDGGLGGAGGSGGSSGADGGADRALGSGGEIDGNEAGVLLPVDTAGPVDDGSANGTDTGENAVDAPSPEDAAVDDRGEQPVDAPGETNATPESDARDDTISVDARGKKTCPASISGSLDRFDSTQVGRLSRVDLASVCGTAKRFPGNGADRLYSHLYDVYQFINITSAPVCFTFTLTYTTYQGLAVVAYSAFDPTDITAGYLGDAGDTLDSPQTIGITVGAGETIDVVVTAAAFGTAPAGSYTLACSTQ